jgi:hypothetical protein
MRGIRGHNDTKTTMYRQIHGHRRRRIVDSAQAGWDTEKITSAHAEHDQELGSGYSGQGKGGPDGYKR